MTLRLKDYQYRALEVLTDYFRACHEEGSADTAYYKTTAKWLDQGLPYHSAHKLVSNGSAEELRGLPYVCIRIPTGGGKTFMACNAAAIALRELVRIDRGVILWLVPSNAIREQTLKALKSPTHPYRQALDSGIGQVEVLDVQEALYLAQAALNCKTVIIVSTVQAFRVDDTEGRRVYEPSESLGAFFSGLDAGQLQDLEKNAEGHPKTSLANLLRMSRPIVIVDEAHNVRTSLSFEVLARFRPSCVLEFTATPDLDKNPSNVLYTVSAAELKAEGMIKMPIIIRGNKNWKELISEAIFLRQDLEKLALEEKAETGEFIRPIILFQAEKAYKGKDALTVEALEKCLLDDFKLSEEEIARATGVDKGLEGVDLFHKDCPIRFIITVEALREGWDCSFAYILCSLAENRSSKAVEQILGRVMRLPRATRKNRSELNKAYAFARFESFNEAAEAIKDGLVQNGFERQEVDSLVRKMPESSQQREFGFSTSSQEAPRNEVWVPMVQLPESLPERFKEHVALDPFSSSLVLRVGTPHKVLVDILTHIPTENGKDEFRRHFPNIVYEKPSFSIPLLCIKQGDLFEPFEETHLIAHPWRLAQRDAFLPEQDFFVGTEATREGTLDVLGNGHFLVQQSQGLSFLSKVYAQTRWLAEGEGWTIFDLVSWLDRVIPHPDIPLLDMVAFLHEVIRLLETKRGFALQDLVRQKYRLKEASEKKVDEHRKQARKEVYQRLILSEEDTQGLVVDPAICFTFDAEEYPYRNPYRGTYRFQKHYYSEVGDLKGEGEEFDCAVFIDQMPEVRFWVRNLDRKGSQSFWLQTSTDKFYPDFVCQLNDGRFLIVESKGEHLWTNDDSKEKRVLGQMWADRSGGKCLFVMPRGNSWREITAKVREK